VELKGAEMFLAIVSDAERSELKSQIAPSARLRMELSTLTRLSSMEPHTSTLNSTRGKPLNQLVNKVSRFVMAATKRYRWCNECGGGNGKWCYHYGGEPLRNTTFSLSIPPALEYYLEKFLRWFLINILYIPALESC
jgi:hypothetical protein